MPTDSSLASWFLFKNHPSFHLVVACMFLDVGTDNLCGLPFLVGISGISGVLCRDLSAHASRLVIFAGM